MWGSFRVRNSSSRLKPVLQTNLACPISSTCSGERQVGTTQYSGKANCEEKTARLARWCWPTGATNPQVIRKRMIPPVCPLTHAHNHPIVLDLPWPRARRFSTTRSKRPDAGDPQKTSVSLIQVRALGRTSSLGSPLEQLEGEQFTTLPG